MYKATLFNAVRIFMDFERPRWKEVVLGLSIKNHCRLLVMLGTAFAVSGGSIVLTCDGAEAKSKSKKGSQHRKSRRIAGHHYLVPPPPPYAPSIMPELQMMAMRGMPKQAVAKKSESEYPYSKYIFTANKADAPRSVKLNNTTTAWN